MAPRPGFPDLTHVRLPAVPTPDVGRLARLAEDAAYVAIGFGILGFQQMQVRRREIARTLDRRRTP